MGKRHTIAARKASGDKKKSQIYAKIGKIIQIAAKNGTDISMNPQLELALQKAKYHNLPKDVVDKAIAKGSGQNKADDLKEIIYEGYGPGGVAILIKALTENTNRTATNIRTIMYKFGGSLGEPNSVARQFQAKGVVVINGKFEIIEEKGNQIRNIIPFDIETLELDLMELEIEDIDFEDNLAIVTISKDSYMSTTDEISRLKYNIIESDLHYLADNKISLDNEDSKRLGELIDALQEDEDIDSIYNNME